MEIILSRQCKCLTGTLGLDCGYFIQRRRTKSGAVRFYTQRSKHGPIPSDGHLRFILQCAELAQMRLHIADVQLTEKEFLAALREANIYGCAPVGDYNAQRILQFQKTYLYDQQKIITSET